MRLGYGVGSPATIDMVSRHLVQDSINAAAIAAARASLDDPKESRPLAKSSSTHASGSAPSSTRITAATSHRRGIS